MKTIVIQIQVPDGVNVTVNQGGGQQQGNGRPFTPQPDPEYPEYACSVCGGDWRLIKAGFSKTKTNADGTPKRFNAFYVCNTDGCEGKPGQAAEPVLDNLPF